MRTISKPAETGAAESLTWAAIMGQPEATAEVPLFALHLDAPRSPAIKLTLGPDDFRSVVTTTDEHGWQAVYTQPALLRGQPMRVTVRLIRGAPETSCVIGVELGEGLRLRRVQFPYLAWRPVQPFDRLLVSTAWGDDIAFPTRAIREYREHQFGEMLTFIETHDGEVSYPYPSIMSMQYMVLHNPSRSFYMGCYSTGDSSLTFNARVLDAQALALSINHYPFLEQGTWTAPECGLAVLSGGWHAAADLYAGHMRPRFTAPDLPPWLREGFHGWVQVGMKTEGQAPHFKFRDLPALYRRISEAGINCIHIYGWSGRAFDTLYPDYQPNPELGTVDELRAALDEIRALGGYAILYINGRLVDPASSFAVRTGPRALALREDGQPYCENYGNSVVFRVACPASAEYQAQLAAEVQRIFGEYHAHALQIDQISCCNGFHCFNPEHGHPTPSSNWLPGIEKELTLIRNVHKGVDQDFWVWCEGCHERFGRFYDVEQGHGEESTWQVGEPMPEQFSYTYPERIVTGLCGSLQKLCHTYAQGKPFDLPLSCLADDRYRALLQDFIALRRVHGEYFMHGAFRDDEGLEAMGSARAFCLLRNDGRGLLVNLWQQGARPGQPCRASLKDPHPGWRADALYPPSLEIGTRGGWFDLRWEGPVASFVVERD